MKKLVIISEGRNTGLIVLNQLKDLMGKYVDIENILLSELQSTDISADLVVFTSVYVGKRAQTYIKSNISYIVAKRVIDHKNIKEIIRIEDGTDVLFINDGYESTKEAIAQIIELGLDHIKYHPYFPDCTSYPQLEIAITPGEVELTPYTPKQLIDIGTRVVDIKTIHEIFNILEIDKYLNDSLVTDYIRDIVKISRSIDESRRASHESQEILEMIVNSLEYGIAFVNIEGKIIRSNSKLEYILGLKKKDLIEKNFKELIPKCNMDLKEEDHFTTQIGNKMASIQIRKVNFSRKIGYIISVNYFDKSNKASSDTKVQYDEFLNRKLHNLSDYYTKNSEVLKLLERAKKFAKTDGTILISGENGTGKEILAQGIHMNSYRNKNVFVPINITTISSNLVESELFGYVEGTFTGAIKGGKRGIFELADGGTIFIDEIGDTPLDVQAKLLRVLEEKKIRRVGGIDEIAIDVRIIAATNKNLLDLINENKFRLDLFFRLNILPLETIPLRERQEDIEYLLKLLININLSYKKIKSLEEFFEEEVIRFLIKYQWKGNVRELINLVEYLVIIYDGEKIGMSSLHSYMTDSISKEKAIILNVSELWLLRQFSKYVGIPMGRKKLAELALVDGQNIGEGKIRTLIKSLENLKLISSIGNRGAIITDLGINAIKKYN